jgi:general secretion pathway protein E
MNAVAPLSDDASPPVAGTVPEAKAEADPAALVEAVAPVGRVAAVEPSAPVEPSAALGLVAALAPAALDEAVIARAIAEATRTGRSAIDVLTVATGRTPLDLAQALAAALDFRFVGSDELATLEPAFEVLPPSEATRRCCAVVRTPGGLLALVADPFDAALRSWLETRTNEVLEWAVAAARELANFIARRAEALRAIDSVLSQAETPGNASTGPDNLSYVSISEDASPIVRLVHSTVYDALRAGASDIHLESTANGLTVRYRIDGVLVTIASVSGMAVAEQVISRIKVMSELDIAERRVPQDGRFTIALDRRPIDFRVSVIPSIFGEDAVLRALDKQALTERLHGLRLDVLGFDMRVVTQLRRLSSLPYGMLLVTGPTGSGKTTTLYAAISETQTGSDKIVTIEDPVEYQLQGVLQIPVNEKKGLTFARGLRSILRHDPDKIMVGEIRDSETAQIAIQSALTGHLVFTTVHANNVFDVVSRFTHMGVDTYSFVSALSGVLAQRLIRIVCEQCAERHVPTRQLLEESQLSVAASAAYNFTIGRGCQHCRGSGYRGRKAIGELLVLNDELREAIINRAPVRQLKELSQKGGVRLIRSVALDLVRRGETTLEEVNRVTVMA